MRLRRLILENFRSFKEPTPIDFDSLTAIIGRNDLGKSSILEAIEIFFNNSTVKIDRDDACKQVDAKNVRIGCIFDNLPAEVVLDTAATTSLAAEEMLNEDGCLEIHKVYDCLKSSCPAAISIYAVHRQPKGKSFLQYKNSDLKEQCSKNSVDISNIDTRCNPALRGILRESVAGMTAERREIPLDKDNAKEIWEALEKHLPAFALFQSDRSSKDGDSEIQQPLKAAIAEAVKAAHAECGAVQEIVGKHLLEVATRTLAKLREMDAELASTLIPKFDRPKWESIFKVTLDTQDNIPVNKRGSGVRRLILLNFFRAEAERRRADSKAPSLIYGIEEPETSQHPNNQRMLLEAFRELAQDDRTQVILTTHVPGLAGLVPIEGLRFLDDQRRVQHGTPEVYSEIAEAVGVIPDHRVKLMICVEGPKDVILLRHFSAMLHATDPKIPDFRSESRLVVVPLGGSTLKEWVEQNWLRQLDIPEYHLYDGFTPDTATYDEAVKQVNARTNGSYAVRTLKREIENYLHPDAIKEHYGFSIAVTDDCDVPMLVAEQAHNSRPNPQKAWSALSNKKKIANKHKSVLCDAVAARVTVARLRERDPNGELEAWFRRIGQFIDSKPQPLPRGPLMPEPKGTLGDQASRSKQPAVQPTDTGLFG